MQSVQSRKSRVEWEEKWGGKSGFISWSWTDWVEAIGEEFGWNGRRTRFQAEPTPLTHFYVCNICTFTLKVNERLTQRPAYYCHIKSADLVFFFGVPIQYPYTRIYFLGYFSYSLKTIGMGIGKEGNRREECYIFIWFFFSRNIVKTPLIQLAFSSYTHFVPIPKH